MFTIYIVMLAREVICKVLWTLWI